MEGWERGESERVTGGEVKERDGQSERVREREHE